MNIENDFILCYWDWTFFIFIVKFMKIILNKIWFSEYSTWSSLLWVIRGLWICSKVCQVLVGRSFNSRHWNLWFVRKFFVYLYFETKSGKQRIQYPSHHVSSQRKQKPLGFYTNIRDKIRKNKKDFNRYTDKTIQFAFLS